MDIRAEGLRRALRDVGADAVVLANLRGEMVGLNAAAMRMFDVWPEDVRAGAEGLFEPLRPERWRMLVQQLLTQRSGGRPVAVGDRQYRTDVAVLDAASGEDVVVLLTLREAEVPGASMPMSKEVSDS